MIGHSQPQSPPTVFSRNLLLAAASLTEVGNSCALLSVDRAGRILDCSPSVATMFGAHPGQIIGRRVAEFIPGLFRTGTSPSYDTRYLVYLCADGEWRRFDARDASGRRFAISLNLSRANTNGQESFQLNLRRFD